MTPSAVIDFTGQYDQVAFTAPAPDSQGPDALHHYQLYLAPNGDLTLESISDLALDQSQGGDKLVLLHGVTNLDLAYFAAAGSGPAQWLSHWEQRATLPRLVRIRLGFAPRDRRQWPDLIIRPAATLDSACAIDANTGRCRGRS
jgi:general secretion pathway protein J